MPAKTRMVPSSLRAMNMPRQAAARAPEYTFTSFIGPDVIVAFVEDGGLNDFALGHEFAFNGLVGSDPFVVRKYRVEQEGIQGTDYVQVASSIDYKVMNAANAGFLMCFAFALQAERGQSPLTTGLLHVPFGFGAMVGIAAMAVDAATLLANSTDPDRMFSTE